MQHSLTLSNDEEQAVRGSRSWKVRKEVTVLVASSGKRAKRHMGVCCCACVCGVVCCGAGGGVERGVGP